MTFRENGQPLQGAGAFVDTLYNRFSFELPGADIVQDETFIGTLAAHSETVGNLRLSPDWRLEFGCAGMFLRRRAGATGRGCLIARN